MTFGNYLQDQRDAQATRCLQSTVTNLW